MKRVLMVVLVAVLCCGFVVGCGNKEIFVLPHNEDVSVTDSMDSIIKIDNLIELTRDNNSYKYLTQISDTYKNAEEELGTQYVKDGNSSVIIDGYEFRMSYVLHEERGLVTVRYRGSNIDGEDRSELVNHLTEMYGSEIKNAEVAYYDEYHRIKFDVENETFVVEAGVHQSSLDEFWISVGKMKK